MKCHADKLPIASIRKWANCNDFHALTAPVHMSTWTSACGVMRCNSNLLWLEELGVMLARGLLTYRKFSLDRKWSMNGSPDWCREKQWRRENCSAKVGQRWRAFFSFRAVHFCTRSGQTVHGPFIPEHISSNVPSVFFSRRRWNPRKHSNVTRGRNVSAMFLRVQSRT